MSDPYPGDEPPAPPIVRPMPDTAGPSRPSCTSCGYELTGLRVEGLCPECGAPVWNPAAQGGDPYLGLAIGAFVCGIFSLVACLAFGPLSLLPAIGGVVCGEMAATRYKRSGLRTSGRGLAVAGRIMSWVGLAIGLGFIGLFAVLIFASP